MSIFAPLPASSLEIRVANLEAAQAQIVAQVAQQQQSNSAAIAAVAALRQAGDDAAADALQDEVNARLALLSDLATQLGTEIQARVLGDQIARSGGPIMVPLVSGALPGPDFLADGFGGPIFIPYVEVI